MTNELRDFAVENHGTIFLLRPQTGAARAWTDEHLPDNDERTYFGNAIVVEHRYIGDIVDGIVNDGLTVE